MSGPSQRAAARQAARRAGSTRPAGPTTARRSSSTSAPGGAARARTAQVTGQGSARSKTSRKAGARTGALAGATGALRGSPSLTGRAVVLAGVLALLVLTLAVPTRELVHQRAEINALRAENAATQGRVDDLTVRQERLQDPAYVTSLIRERLHYVLPGEVGYVVLDPSEAPAPVKGKAAAAVAWYSSLWSSVESADGAATPATGPAPIVLPSNAPR